MIYCAVIILSYLLGSIPFGFIAGKFAGIDIRQRGSGNIGATNVLRVIGKRFGYIVFVADALKGFVAVRFGLWVGSHELVRSHALGIMAAAFVVIGHSFPVWLRFRGGKGVATSAGACVGLVPLATLLVTALWVGVFFAFGFVSVASITAACALPILVGVFSLRIDGRDHLLLAFSVTIAALVIWRHRDNIVRLAKGTEPRFKRR